jgi:hypothetical protein
VSADLIHSQILGRFLAAVSNDFIANLRGFSQVSDTGGPMRKKDQEVFRKAVELAGSAKCEDWYDVQEKLVCSW